MKSQVVRCEAAAKELTEIDSVFDTMVSPQQLEFCFEVSIYVKARQAWQDIL